MRSIIWAVVFLGIFVACQNEKKTDVVKEEVRTKVTLPSDKIEFSEKKLKPSNIKICQDGPCTEMDIQYLMAEGNSEAAKKINEENEEVLAGILSVDQEKPTASSVDEAVENFVTAYINEVKANPNRMGTYEAIIEQKMHDTGKLIGLETSFYTYTGGAHGGNGTYFTNFDAKTGERLYNADLVSNWTDLTDYAEKKFREENNLAPNADLQDAGFFFENNRFGMPLNMTITRDEVILIYNPYEIASYAQGQLKYVLPKDEVAHWLHY